MAHHSGEVLPPSLVILTLWVCLLCLLTFFPACRLTAELFADDESTASAGTRCGGGSHPAADAAGEMGTIPEPSTVGSNPEQKAGKVLRLISTAAALVLLIAAGSNARVLKVRSLFCWGFGETSVQLLMTACPV